MIDERGTKFLTRQTLEVLITLSRYLTKKLSEMTNKTTGAKMATVLNLRLMLFTFLTS